MSTESNFWKLMSNNLPEKWHATSIEYRTGGGIPDVHIACQEGSFWVELKVTKNNSVKLTPHQIAWNTAYSHAGGVSFILVKHLGSGIIYLFEGRMVRGISSDGLGFRDPLWSGRSGSDAWIAIRDAVASGSGLDSGFGVPFCAGRGKSGEKGKTENTIN